MVKITEKNGSKKLYQWDLNREITISADADVVDFAHKNDAEAVRVKPVNKDGVLTASIPNSLLQSSQPIVVWLVKGDQTIYGQVLPVIPRQKPADYVETEDDVLSYVALEKRVAELEESTNTEVATIEEIKYEFYEGNLLLASGNTKISSNKVTSDKVVAQPGETYLLTCSANWGNPLYVVYDSENNVIDLKLSTSTFEGTVIVDSEIIMPEDTAYFRIGCNLEIQPEGHKIKKKTNNSYYWSGKRLIAIGDSLTEKNFRTSKNYLDYISEKTGITVENLGISGTGYKKGEDNNNAFYQRISSIEVKDNDVVIIFGSFNDLSTTLNAKIGSTGDSTTDTLCGCINKTIDTLLNNYPLTTLGIVTPTPWKGNRPDKPDSNASLYVDAIVSICKLRGIPCLDLFRCSGLRPWNSLFRELAYSKDEDNGVHPDEKGHALIAPKIKMFLETLVI